MTKEHIVVPNEKEAEILFEIADTSAYILTIKEHIQQYLLKLNDKYDESQYNVEYLPLINKKKLSSQYKIIIKSYNLDEILLYEILENIKNEFLGLDKLKGKVVVLSDTAQNFYHLFFYEKIMTIEKNLRSILYQVEMQFYGASWEQKLKKSIKKNKRNSTKLQELYFDELILSMFEVYINVEPYDCSKLDSLTKDELIEFIKNKNPTTFWNSFFPKIEIKKEKLKEVIKLRNDIMHFKEINYKDYNNFYRLTDNLIKGINKAEKQLEGSPITFSPEFMIKFVEFNNMIKDLTAQYVLQYKTIADTFNKLTIPLANQIKILSNAVQPLTDVATNATHLNDIQASEHK